MTDPLSNTDELESRDEVPTPPDGPADDEATSEDGAVVGAAEDAEPRRMDEAESLKGDPEATEEAAGSETEQDEEGESVPPADELQTLEEDLAALNDRHLRLAAEFNNYRRRVEQERLDLWGRAQADLLARLLDVLDDLQRVADLDLESATVEGITEGIDLVERKFARVLGDLGVEVVDPLGEVFDPEIMEAMMREIPESDEEDDRVARVLQKGYKLKGQLVRPARVSVYKLG